MSETSEMTRPKIGEVGWNELVSTDTKASANFYGKLFGWQAEPFTPQGNLPATNATTRYSNSIQTPWASAA